MLISMTVHNIALIEELDVQFHHGMHVLTGETGAGKSIVVDSINLMLGERADRSLIRTGCENATVEAMFDITDRQDIQKLLDAESLEASGGYMSVYREISMNGRNICRVCGVIVPLSFLRQITEKLVDIHGQHEHQSLLSEQYHREYLDAFGDETHQCLLADVKEKYSAWHKAGAAYNSLRRENAQREQRLAFLEGRIKELQEAKPVLGEKEQLAAQRIRFADNEKISNALQQIYQNITASEGTTLGVSVLLRDAMDHSQNIEEYDPKYKAMAERLQSLFYEIEEIALEVREMADDESYDEEAYEKVQTRLDVYRRLEKRYGMEADELCSYFEELSKELETIQSMDENLRKAETLFKTTLSDYRTVSAALTASRKAVAKRFEAIMESQLGDLGMENTRFECVFTAHETNGKVLPSPLGDDHIGFYISPNPGEPLKPLKKTASGGEMSRIMLAMKASAADKHLIPTMIFDEIDTGISGRIANVIAEKMDDIARYHQVICVSHLPQIAAMADHHYLVKKSVANQRTITTLEELSLEKRVHAIAGLLGAGGADVESGYVHARNMIEAAAARKQA